MKPISDPKLPVRRNPSVQTFGFTLIELLVVISIIALLISILLPVLRQAHESARMATCASNERQMGIALEMYAQDYNDYLPPASMASLESFDVLLDPYLNTLPPITSDSKDGKLWQCPSDSIERLPGWVDYQPRSYGYNYYLGITGNISTNSARITELPPRVTIIADAWEAVIGTRSETGAAQIWYGLHGAALFHYPGNLFGIFHLNSGGNYLFTDGSAQFYSVDDMFNRQDIAAPTRPNGDPYWVP